MDGPAEATQERAPKRPYPEEKEDRQDVCALESLIQLLTIKPELSKEVIQCKERRFWHFIPIFYCTILGGQL